MIKYSNSKVSATTVQGAIDEHLNKTMPHEMKDVSTNKTYRFGLKQEGGYVKFIYEEVI